jgi:hypothetical protein
MSDVSMQDYLDGNVDDDPGPGTTETSETTNRESPWLYSRNHNDNGTPQRCRYCGADFPTQGRRNHMLNRHEAECEERDQDGE